MLDDKTVVIYYDRTKQNRDQKKNDNTSNTFIETAINNLIYFFNQRYQTKAIAFDKKSVPGDIVIMWSIWCIMKDKTMYRKKIYDMQKNNNKAIICVEKGFLNRDYYYSIGWNGTVGFGTYFTTGKKMPGDRWNKLRIQLNPIKYNPDGYILLCGQLPWDTQLQHINYIDWLLKASKAIQKHSCKKLLYRPHPLFKHNHYEFYHKKFPKKMTHDICQLEGIETSKHKTLAEAMKGASCVVALNSTSLIEALLTGLPFYCFDKGSLVYDLANRDWSKIDHPDIYTEKTRLQKCYDIAYTQWNAEEIKNGDFWPTLAECYEEALTYNPYK